MSTSVLPITSHNTGHLYSLNVNNLRSVCETHPGTPGPTHPDRHPYPTNACVPLFGKFKFGEKQGHKGVLYVSND